MKISIITVNFNNVRYLEDTINSVLDQTYKDVEYILIDGKSTDGSHEIIEKYIHDIDCYISEPDEGVYDAMNKGINNATGDIIGFLNSDDIFIDSYVLSMIANIFAENPIDSLYANLYYVDSIDTNKIIRKWRSSSFVQGAFRKGWHPPHPTFYVRRKIYEKYGNFDKLLDISADFELMLRFLEKHQISTYFLDEYIVKMRLGGESNKSISNILKGNKNTIKAFRKNGISVSPFYPIYRLAPKLKQFF